MEQIGDELEELYLAVAGLMARWVGAAWDDVAPWGCSDFNQRARFGGRGGPDGERLAMSQMAYIWHLVISWRGGVQSVDINAKSGGQEGAGGCGDRRLGELK